MKYVLWLALVTVLVVQWPGPVMAVLGAAGAVAVWVAVQPFIVGIGVGALVARVGRWLR